MKHISGDLYPLVTSGVSILIIVVLWVAGSYMGVAG